MMLKLAAAAALFAMALNAQPAGTIERLDKELDTIVPADARIEKIATGFQFTEGPLYHPSGYLVFSDVQGNVIRKWTPGGAAIDFRRPSGYDGTDMPAGAFSGSNGLTLDPQGRVIICEHGNRRVTRLEKDGKLTVVVEKFEGRRLNSPNDVVFKSDGAMYFTDPPYGLLKQDEDTKKELGFNGVFRLDKAGKLTLLAKEMIRPNGLAFSPDEKFLYVANSDAARKIWMKYPVNADGTLGTGAVFFDATSMTEPGVPDGMKVDTKGNVYATGPGGVLIFAPSGKHLGTIKPAETPANVGWGPHATGAGDAPLKKDQPLTTLYITARTSVYRIRLAVPGVRP